MVGGRVQRVFLSLIIFLIMSVLSPYGGILAEDSSSQSTGPETAASIHEGDATEGDHGEGDRRGDLLDLLYRFINFALLVIILFIVIRKTPVKDFLSTRSEAIRQKLEDLRREKEEAENKYLSIEKELKDFENKRTEIINQFKEEGLIEKEKIISEAKERVEEIIAQSESTIQQEIQSARDRLKKEVVDLAAQKAQEIIAKEIDEKDQDQLISDFLERVGKIH